MRIAIAGTRGIPNAYGGFEQFAEYLAAGLARRGHQVLVYLPDFHPYREPAFQGAILRRIPSPEHILGSAANFTYDYLCLKDAIRDGYDVVLECGYGTAAPALALCRLKRTRVVTNMDGMEWQRAKWSAPVKWLTRKFEALAVARSHLLVADNQGIQTYLLETYGARSEYIPYGADLVGPLDAAPLAAYHVQSGVYSMLIARLEPENNVGMILDGHVAAGLACPLLVVGNHRTAYGAHLVERFAAFPGIRFLGPVYDKGALDLLRQHAAWYFHGHSVGGTNPSLLEAMACGARIAAHDNPFNRAVVADGARYFATSAEVSEILQSPPETRGEASAAINRARIVSEYSWDSVISRYEAAFVKVLG